VRIQNPYLKRGEQKCREEMVLVPEGKALEPEEAVAEAGL
jgi:hypothetical protein